MFTTPVLRPLAGLPSTLAILAALGRFLLVVAAACAVGALLGAAAAVVALAAGFVP